MKKADKTPRLYAGRALLTERQFEAIVKRGRCCDELRKFVARPAGRPTLGDKALTGAERMRRTREKAKAMERKGKKR